MTLRTLLAAAIIALIATPSCGTDTDTTAILPQLTVLDIGPRPLLPGTNVIIKGTGFVPPEVALINAYVDGQVSGVPVTFMVQPERIDDETLLFNIDLTIGSILIRPNGLLLGNLVIERIPLLNAEPDVAIFPLSIGTETQIFPSMQTVQPTVVYPGEEMQVQGAGFLHPSEGMTLVRFEGEFQTVFPVETKIIDGLTIPAAGLDPMSRSTLSFELTPDVFGIRPGAFVGAMSIVNQPMNSTLVESPPLNVGPIPLKAPYVNKVFPLQASRGQRITFDGRGFLRSDGLFQSASIILLEGTFSPNRGAPEEWIGSDAIALLPDALEDNTRFEHVLRLQQDVDGEIYGFGTVPGVFVGKATPVVLAGEETVSGEGLPVQIVIRPPTQMVYVKLLPSFDEALDAFGLVVEREAVKARIMEVLKRDYEGVNIGFSFEWPDDFEEFTTVEIGAYDPNGSNLFGLDNTAGKDVGNLRFDDVVGGFNADTRASNSAAYGGVFPAEFLNISPTLSNNPLASPRFDDIFAAVVPLLGGEPANPGEMLNGSWRGQAISESVRVFANLVGNTVTHEVAHALGLTSIDGHFHNIGDNPGWIMDSGGFRPFPERAEIDGYPPAKFSPFNREYLELVLPME
jgi:hypothetical protein